MAELGEIGMEANQMKEPLKNESELFKSNNCDVLTDYTTWIDVEDNGQFEGKTDLLEDFKYDEWIDSGEKEQLTNIMEPLNSDTWIDIGEEVLDIRNYGVDGCSKITGRIFTPEIIQDWKYFTPELRETIFKKYANAIAKILNIDFKGVAFIPLPKFLLGESRGNGVVYLNQTFVEQPENIIKGIETIAHEIRHEFQTQALKNPQKYGLDEKTRKEWTVANATYNTIENPSGYDPFAYEYNPLELDARIFSESIVNNFIRDIYNGVA